MDKCNTAEIDTGEATLFVCWYGSGPTAPFAAWFSPNTLDVAHRRAVSRPHFYSCPTSTPDHAPYSKRSLAQDMVIVMEHLGFVRFSVAGHDRGGRVAISYGIRSSDTC